MRAALLALAMLVPSATLAGNQAADATLWAFDGAGSASSSPEGGVGCMPGAISIDGTVHLVLADRAEQDLLLIRFDMWPGVTCLVRAGVGAGDPEAGWEGLCVDPQLCEWGLRPESDGTYRFGVNALGTWVLGWVLHGPSLARSPLDVPL